jgi:hypothetical protein
LRELGESPIGNKNIARQQHPKKERKNIGPDSSECVGGIQNAFEPKFRVHSMLIKVFRAGMLKAQLPEA